MNDIYLGHHIGIRYGFTTTVDYAVQTGVKVFQMFFKSNRTLKPIRPKSNDLQIIRDKAIKNKIKILIHGSYMINFCHPKNTSMYNTSFSLLKDDLYDSVSINGLGVVIHMGHNVERLKITDKQAADNFITGIVDILKVTPDSSTIILETGAGQGREICTSISHLGKLRDKIINHDKDKFHKRIKICIDTCHIFAAGYDISNPKYIPLLSILIDAHIGWNNIAAIHLNDSKEPLNSKKDRHADIGKGYIGLNGLLDFVNICISYRIPIVLETPTEHYDNIRFHYTDQINLILGKIKIDNVNK